MLVSTHQGKITDNTWCLASVAPNPFRVWSFYKDKDSACDNMDIANHREDKCFYEPMLYGEYTRKEREALLSQPMKEVTEEQYDEMLCVLPPLRWTRGVLESFFMSEFWTGTYTTMYASFNGKFYQKMVDYSDTSTWITPDMCLAHEQDRQKVCLHSHQVG